jgi:TonB-dependent SusC/RagA subfamily outer membrane receptor
MKIKYLFWSILLIAIFGQIELTQAQSKLPLPNFLAKLDSTSHLYAQEKIYLHLDKPYYAIGDDIWFKVYTINAKTGQPSINSRQVYIELINEKDSITQQLLLPMQGGITWGDFKLGDNLTEGNYRIRAYTQWMRNAGTEFFFDKTIKIGNSWANKVFTSASHSFSTENNAQKISTSIRFYDKQQLPYADCPVHYEVVLNQKTIERGKGTTSKLGDLLITAINKKAETNNTGFIIANITLPNKQVIKKEILLNTNSDKFDVQFFAEGGHFVAGLPNKIAVKAINGSGLGEFTKGTISSSDGVEITSFETNKLGMGSFFVNPQEGQKYQATLSFANGSKQTVNLPNVENSGVVLSVNNMDSTKISIRALFTADLLNKGEYRIIAQHNGTIYFASPLTVSNQVVSLVVPKDNLPSGIMQISLINSEYLPLSERIVFINKTQDKIDINAENLAKNYQERGKVSFNISANNQSKPVQGSFSVAVTNTSSVKPDPENESNILTRLLLTSELSGYVEKPNYYFLNEDKNTRQDLDNLLLTQGWRRTEWQKIAQDKLAKPSFPTIHKTKISGTVTKGGKPVVQGKVMLVSFTGGFFSIDTLTDDKGRFSFDEIEFQDSTKFVVQARTQKDRKFVDIVMDTVPEQLVTKNPNTGDIEINVNNALAAYLAESNKYFDDKTLRGLLNRTILLDEVKIVEKRKSTYESSNLGGAGNADAVFHAKDLETTFSLAQFLQGRVAGVTVFNGQAYSRGNQEPMKISVDGMMLEGEDINLESVVVADIETLEILKSISTTAIYGSQGGTGVIVITTKKGGGLRTANPYTPGLIKYNPKGYAVVREFYSPNYEVKPDNRPDLRTTVFWEPQLVTDKTGKATIQYFNTDVSGTYRIVIEGIDVDGNLARKVLNYQVK